MKVIPEAFSDSGEPVLVSDEVFHLDGTPLPLLPTEK